MHFDGVFELRRVKMRNVAVLLAVAAVVALAAPAQAGFNVAIGDYNDPGNWDPNGVPFWPTNAFVTNGGTAQISGQIPDAPELYVGWGGNGHLEMSTGGQIGGAGTGHDGNPWFHLGGHNGLVNAATFKQTDGNIKSARMWVGEGVGTGEWTISGGSIDAGFLSVGNASGRGLFKIDNATTGGPSSIALSSYYAQDAGSTLEIVLSATGGTTLINVTGNATLAGTLQLDDAAYTSGAAKTIDVLTTAGTLDYSGLTLAGAPAGSTLTNTGGTLQITYVPEPATMVLLGLGGIGMLIRRRRK
jgi:hypothetical protein